MAAGWPDFVVVGAARAGTTALHRALVGQPGVFVPEEKEPRFFAADGQRPRYTGPWDEHVVNSRTVWREEDYLALFASAGAGERKGEVSPLYLDVEGTADRIHAANPDMRVVVVLRDPVERAHSQWRLQRQWGQEDMGFAEAIGAEEERLAAGWSSLYGYRSRGFYGRHLTPYVERFGVDRVHLVRFDDLVAAPAATFSAVLAFLGVDGPVVAPPTIANEAAVPRSPAVAEQLRARRTRRVLGLLGSRPADALLAAATRANTRSAPLDSAVAADLRTGFTDDLLDLQRRTGFDTAAWRR